MLGRRLWVCVPIAVHLFNLLGRIWIGFSRPCRQDDRRYGLIDLVELEVIINLDVNEFLRRAICKNHLLFPFWQPGR